MKRKLFGLAVISATLVGFAGAASAACTSTTAKGDLTDAQVMELYNCIKSDLRKGYASQGNALAKAYQSWGAASTIPGGVGNHGSRFLTTFVNDIGYLEYVKFNDTDAKMPTGTIIAKESFNVTKKGMVKKGPLFFMEKVAAGTADKTGDWKFSMVSTKGKPMKIKQSFCYNCHGAFDGQDALGYPEEDYRIPVFPN